MAEVDWGVFATTLGWALLGLLAFAAFLAGMGAWGRFVQDRISDGGFGFVLFISPALVLVAVLIAAAAATT